ncbi:integrin beta-1-binding protein 2 isoform X3 [Phascolarctos cinereus]|uniref:Integrin beta-1-binding protein 2 isoform X3 n=1 Tax=Phascolarctos cinereus TaxID=38626 RepID=A0A6P5JMJ2_PHACI|nr:integrin beta-1-binding protein 2 isoform X3 [Phascolarctos cinereus]
MSVLCFNKGCGQHFDPDINLPDGCRHHPGVPIFHDALKGWSCCHKRTTDFSEFLSIQGCTLGPHCAEKPLSALRGPKHLDTIPKSAETLRRERPKEELNLYLLPLSVSHALETALEQKELVLGDPEPGAGLPNTVVHPGSICQNPGCGTRWVSCRYDWHQTASVVVVTVYGQGPLPALSWVKASPTKLHIYISFEGNRVFQEQMELWGVITVEQSSVSLMLSRAEITLSKADPGPWAQLEQPGTGMPAEKVGEDVGSGMIGEEREDSDDNLSWTEEEEEEVEGE